MFRKDFLCMRRYAFVLVSNLMMFEDVEFRDFIFAELEQYGYWRDDVSH